jgi:hypothetical protein
MACTPGGGKVLHRPVFGKRVDAWIRGGLPYLLDRAQPLGKMGR